MKTSSKITYTVLGIILLSTSLQGQNYTWKKGNNSINQPGIYGTIGIAGAANKPGARESAVSWKDASGNFWLFGGFGMDASSFNQLNDLWKYDPLTNNWAFMKGNSTGGQAGVYGSIGVSAAANKPGSRYKAVSWTDNNGNFWLFGGNGYDATSQQGYLNDLWKYDPANNEWVWIRGSNAINQSGTYGSIGVSSNSNTPGAREGAVAWADASGNLWMFGGYGYESTANVGMLNDLWKYNIATNQWTWMKGSNMYDQNGTYGTMGSPAPANTPGGRRYANGWLDLNGNFWLLGGYGYPATGPLSGHMNDLWKFDPLTTQWSWIKGSSTFNQLGVYGSQGTAAPGNYPGSRVAGTTWTDAAGDLWILGGYAYGVSIPTVDFMNDLWRYTISSNQWTWMRGGNSISQAGVYGTLGVPAPANTPGGRSNAVGWINSGGIWLFGGNGYDTNSQSSSGMLNDLWSFGSCNSQTITVASSPTAICPGSSATLTASGASLYAWSNGGNSSSIVVSPAASTVYVVHSADPNSCGDSAVYNLTVNSVPSVSAVSSDYWACWNHTVYLSASGASTYSWSTGQTGSLVLVTVTNTMFTVVGTSTAGCSNTASVIQNFVICEGLGEQEDGIRRYFLTPNPSSGELSIEEGNSEADLAIRVFNSLGQCVLDLERWKTGTRLRTDLPEGIYHVWIRDSSQNEHFRKWIIQK